MCDDAPSDDHSTSAGTAESLCLKCGYNLTGLHAQASCPECATPVADSQRGELLQFADPQWVRSLYRGTLFVFRGIASFLILLLLIVVLQLARQGPIWQGVILVLSLLQPVILLGSMVWGIWLLTAQDPRLSLTEQSWSTRRWIRAGTIVAVPALLAAPFLPLPVDLIARLLGLMCVYLVLIGCLRELQHIARRIPNEKLRKEAGGRVRELLAVGLVFLVLRGLVFGMAISNTPLTPYDAGITRAFSICRFVLPLAVLMALNTLTKFNGALRKAVEPHAAHPRQSP